MRILLLSQGYDPEPSFRAHSLANELVKRGHQVTAITGFPNYPTGKVYAGYRIRWRQWEQRDGVGVLRLPLYPDHSRSIMRRSLNYLSFAASASLLGPALCGSADVMWAYHPPLTVGIPAWWISMLRRVPFIYEIQDMWPETIAVSGMLTNRVPIGLLNLLGQWIYRRAAAITVISSGFKDNLIGKGVPADKIHVIPNWADEDIFRPVPPSRDLGEKYGLLGRFNIIFAGNMGFAQGLEVVLEAAVLLRDIPSIQFVLIGDGVELARLKAQAKRLNLSNVQFIDRQPSTEMPHFFAWAGGLLVHLRDDPLHHITIPSKILTYLACGWPILCAVAGDGAEITRQAGAGVICQPGNPQALAQAARILYSMSPAEREAMGEAGREAFLKNYTRKVLVDRYESLFQIVAQGHNTETRHRDRRGS